jgi:hypothetical protein
MKKIITLASLILALAKMAQAEEANFTYADLAGKWEGTPPLGGKLTIDIKVSPEGKIEGHGRIAGTYGGAPVVNGKVADRVVDIDYYYPTGNSGTIRFVCSWIEPKLLNCVTRKTKFKSEFRKID